MLEAEQFHGKRLANYTADDGESLLALAPANGGQLANSVGLAISPPRQDGAWSFVISHLSSVLSC